MTVLTDYSSTVLTDYSLTVLTDYSSTVLTDYSSTVLTDCVPITWSLSLLLRKEINGWDEIK